MAVPPERLLKGKHPSVPIEFNCKVLNRDLGLILRCGFWRVDLGWTPGAH